MKHTKVIQLNMETLRKDTAISELFKKQGHRDIINKLINLEPLTKLESEKYSRLIKPRINAVIDFYQTAILVRSKS